MSSYQQNITGEGPAREVCIENLYPGEEKTWYLPELKNHIINVGDGGILIEGMLIPTDIGTHLTSLIEQIKAYFKTGTSKDLILYAHGGLTNEKGGLDFANRFFKVALNQNIYPIFFVWNSGFLQTLASIIQDHLPKAFITDPLLEVGPIADLGKAEWTRMKQNAIASSQKMNGAARLFLDALAKEPELQDVNLHLVGHSAGSIFHGAASAYWTGNKSRNIASVTLLAPAMTLVYFEQTFKVALEQGKIENFYLATLTDETEQDDNCIVYRKSLLYWVSNAFEASRGEPILGMQKFTAPKYGEHLEKLNSAMVQSGKLLWELDSRYMGCNATSHGGFGDKGFEPTMNRIHRSSHFVKLFTLAPIERPRTPINAKAFLVGINEYPSPNELYGCINDVDDIALFLVNRCGWVPSNIRKLVDRRATKAAILERLNGMVECANPGDLLVFYYSGHGSQLALRSSTDGSVNTVHESICPIDFDGTRETAIIDNDFKDIFSRLPKEVTFIWISDSCFSGGLDRTFKLSNSLVTSKSYQLPSDLTWRIITAASKGLKTAELKDSMPQSGLAFLAASTATQSSSDSRFLNGSPNGEGRPNGAFTYYLLRHLEADSGFQSTLADLIVAIGEELKASIFSQEPECEGDPKVLKTPLLNFGSNFYIEPPKNPAEVK